MAEPDLDAFIAWAKIVGAYQVVDAYERFESYWKRAEEEEQDEKG